MQSFHRKYRNTLCELGLLLSLGPPVDPVAEVLQKRYSIVSAKSWRTLLGEEYAHGLGLLRQADATFFSGPSYWLATQSSFNQTVFLALQSHLSLTGTPGVVTTKDKNGELIDYGVTLDRGNQFSKCHPVIADCFRGMNTRRNRLPHAHPYEKKSADRNRYLKPRERNHFMSQLRMAYTACLRIMP